MTTLTLEQKISKAAHMLANGQLVSFRGASADTYLKVERLANRIKQDREFPQCPCGECDQDHTTPTACRLDFVRALVQNTQYRN